MGVKKKKKENSPNLTMKKKIYHYFYPSYEDSNYDTRGFNDSFSKQNPKKQKQKNTTTLTAQILRGIQTTTGRWRTNAP